jgi:hypothetical protein
VTYEFTGINGTSDHDPARHRLSPGSLIRRPTTRSRAARCQTHGRKCSWRPDPGKSIRQSTTRIPPPFGDGRRQILVSPEGLPDTARAVAKDLKKDLDSHPSDAAPIVLAAPSVQPACRPSTRTLINTDLYGLAGGVYFLSK